MSDGERRPGFQRNETLELFLTEFNRVLLPSHKSLLDRAQSKETHSKVFVVGAPRSGTTLFMQWLAVTGQCAYPSNLMARFYGAPLVGAHVQRLIQDRDLAFRDEFADVDVPQDFRSSNGKTRGLLAPNEFWYFWRRIGFPDDNSHLYDQQLSEHLDIALFRSELDAFAATFGKAFALKSLIANHNILLLNEIIDVPLFVWIQRSPVFNIQSILEARHKQYGTFERWYSFEVPEGKLLKNLPPLEAVAAQVKVIQHDIQRQFEQLDERRKLIVKYEDFCRNPTVVFDALNELLSSGVRPSAPRYEGPMQFRARENWRLEKWSMKAAGKAYEAAPSRASAC